MTFNHNTLILMASVIGSTFASSVLADQANIDMSASNTVVEDATSIDAEQVKARAKEHGEMMREHAESVKQQAQQTGAEVRTQAQNMAQERAAGMMEQGEKPAFNRPEMTRPEFAQRPEMPQRPVEFNRPSFR